MPQLIATLCAGIFCGAAIYISVVQQSAANRVGEGFPARFFAPMYHRAAPMQASLAVVGSLCGTISWLASGALSWGLGAILLFFSVPWTLLVIRHTNDRLLADTLDPHSDEAAELLRRWSLLHWARSISSLVAFALFLLAPRTP